MTATTFRFRVGPEFHAVPLDEGTQDEMRKFARDYWGEREELAPLHALTEALYEENARILTEGGAVYNALGVFPVEATPSRISRATLTIGVRELDNPDPLLTATGITRTLEQSGEAQLIALPAGPAAVHIAGSRAVWELPEGEQEQYFVRVEVWLPFPAEDRLLLLCLSTPDVQDLRHYQAVLADIADTVAFGEPTEPDSPFGSY
ncbi:hypothetical protein ACVNF4_04460 [Streptomyces sp. S6]